MTFSITTLGMSLSIIDLNVTLTIKDLMTLRISNQHFYADSVFCRVLHFLIIVLSVIVLIVVTPNFVTLSIVAPVQALRLALPEQKVL